MASASSLVWMPPAALTLQRPPTVLRMSATSCTVAPPVEKPVLVFTNDAPAAIASSQARTICSSLSRQHSRMTFTGWPWAAFTTAEMSSMTYWSSPATRWPPLITMSISEVPSATACAASAAFAGVEHAPRGNPMQVVTPTPVSARRLAASAVQHELIATVAKRYLTASSHRRSISVCVAFCLRLVWSM